MINLEGLSDHSGIIIALYNLAYLDTTIVRINNQYPQIGVHIDQHTEFDHRLQSPIITAETFADGSFEMKKIPMGTFNLVAVKDGWGFKYLYEIEIIEGGNDLIDVITLYEEIHISGNISDNIVVATDHHLVIDDDTDFVPNTSSLTIHPGAVIRINPGIDLIIHGSLTAQGEEDNMFWVTSNDGFENSQLNTQNPTLSFEDIAHYNSMELTNLAQVEDEFIEWGKWGYANTCLLNQVNNAHIQNGVFRDAECGFKSTDIDSSFCENLLISNINNESLGAIHYLDSVNGTISNNIINNCFIGIKAKEDSDPEIFNNYLLQCNLGIELLKSNSIVHNNEIRDCSIGLKIAGQASPNIERNDFNNEISIYIGGYAQYYSNSQPEIHNNNIKSANYYYYIMQANMYDISAGNNFYYTAVIDEIDLKIFDKLDYPPENQHEVGLVLYEPILTELNENAGVQQ